MRSLTMVLPLCAAFIAACSDSITRPERAAGRAGAKPDHLLIFGSGWTLVSLPFTPAGINDAGAIVGSQNGEAVLWQSGTVTVLPHFPGLAGPYSAKAITAKGLILGVANGFPLLWSSPTAAPMEITTVPMQPLDPVAVNDNYVVVGNLGSTERDPWEWTPSTGVRFLPEYFAGAKATGLNSSGWVSGYTLMDNGARMPSRWDPSGNWANFNSSSYGVALGINDAGVAVGNAEINCSGSDLSYTPCPSNVSTWGIDGTFSFVAGAPAPYGYAGYAVAISNAGRVIGNTYSPWTVRNGTLTRLSSPDANPPQLVGVNTCGSIVATRSDVAGTGYLWRRGSSFMPTCDVTVTAVAF